jgi:ClpP class serine protease
VTATAYCASAGYYVASQSDEIHMEDQAASSIGSIGTLLIYENWTKHLEQQGIAMEIMRASKSQDKGLVNWIEELPDAARAELQALLDACQAEFEGAVKRGRSGKINSEDVFTGKMYSTSQAIKLGLADRKGNLQTAIQRVLQLSN